MSMSFFFTLLDDSLRPRGSRDPLGSELIWSEVGRKLIANLTTVTSNLDNFIFALLGFWFASDKKKGGDAEWEYFERFEQVTSRARVSLEHDGVLGTRSIKRGASAAVH